MENTKINSTTETSNEVKESRFEFALFINDNVICKRTFMMYDFIEGSMATLEFKDTIDDIVGLIQKDLESKSRVYTWGFYSPYSPSEEFTNPISEEYPVTFKFVVYDNKQEVYTRIWDGYGYPRAIRNNVDLTNKVLKQRFKDGTEVEYDAEKITNGDGYIPYDIKVLHEMICDKEDLIPVITKMICETCTPWGNSPYKDIRDYTLFEEYGDNRYSTNPKNTFNKYAKAWEKAVAEKTKEYFRKK